MDTKGDIAENLEIQKQQKIRGSTDEFQLLTDIREIRTLKVSARGNGLCLYLPKDLTEVYGIASGDRLKVKFREQYRMQADECESTSKHTHSPLAKRDGR